MLWDALVLLPDSWTFMVQMIGFVGLFLLGGGALGTIMLWIERSEVVVEEVVKTSSVEEIQEWAAAHSWVEVALPGPAHRDGAWDVAPVREILPGRRLRGAPQTVWGGASALSRMIEHDIADLFLGLRPQFKIRHDPSWLQI